MPVSFLDITPSPHKASVWLDTVDGPREVEFAGVSLRALGEIARRFPTFAKLLDGSGGFNSLEQAEAIAAVAAVSIGHPGDAAVEDRFGGLVAGELVRIWATLQTLSFPPIDPDPLPVGAAANGAGVVASDQNSLSLSSS